MFYIKFLRLFSKSTKICDLITFISAQYFTHLTGYAHAPFFFCTFWTHLILRQCYTCSSTAECKFTCIHSHTSILLGIGIAIFHDHDPLFFTCLSYMLVGYKCLNKLRIEIKQWLYSFNEIVSEIGY